MRYALFSLIGQNRAESTLNGKASDYLASKGLVRTSIKARMLGIGAGKKGEEASSWKIDHGCNGQMGYLQQRRKRRRYTVYVKPMAGGIPTPIAIIINYSIRTCLPSGGILL